jgi:hypothetical protein
MNDDASDTISPPGSGEAGRQTEAGREAAAGKKRRPRSGSKAATAALEARIGHKFADGSLLATALTHVSALKSSRKRGDSYQRLEFLGDHVLGLIVSDMLYRAFPNASITNRPCSKRGKLRTKNPRLPLDGFANSSSRPINSLSNALSLRNQTAAA